MQITDYRLRRAADRLGLGRRVRGERRHWRMDYTPAEVARAAAEVKRERTSRPKRDRTGFAERAEARAQVWAKRYMEEGDWDWDTALKVARAAATGDRHVPREFPGFSREYRAQLSDDLANAGGSWVEPPPLFVPGLATVTRGNRMTPAERAEMLDAAVAECACGRCYAAKEWARLRSRGWQEGLHGEEWELRDCECGSTISGPKRPMLAIRATGL